MEFVTFIQVLHSVSLFVINASGSCQKIWTTCFFFMYCIYQKLLYLHLYAACLYFIICPDSINYYNLWSHRRWNSCVSSGSFWLWQFSNTWEVIYHLKSCITSEFPFFFWILRYISPTQFMNQNLCFGRNLLYQSWFQLTSPRTSNQILSKL